MPNFSPKSDSLSQQPLSSLEKDWRLRNNSRWRSFEWLVDVWSSALIVWVNKTTSKLTFWICGPYHSNYAVTPHNSLQQPWWRDIWESFKEPCVVLLILKLFYHWEGIDSLCFCLSRELGIKEDGFRGKTFSKADVYRSTLCWFAAHEISGVLVGSFFPTTAGSPENLTICCNQHCCAPPIGGITLLRFIKTYGTFRYGRCLR